MPSVPSYASLGHDRPHAPVLADAATETVGKEKGREGGREGGEGERERRMV